MKTYFVFSIIFGSFIFSLSPSAEKNTSHSFSDDSWSGAVYFTETRTGPGIVVYQHRMGAIITNDTGTATHSLITEIKDKYKVTCNGQGRSWLEVGIDDTSYSIFAGVPGCQGIRVSAAGNVESTGEDETGITVPKQPLGPNRNSFRGTLVIRETAGNTIITTTYTWNVYK
ncbi:MAG: hypothetical protein JNK14_07915 [Chitinophagaceae bacterium]|nr:hypothetical protein [Chitinophagaceae bacterium]